MRSSLIALKPSRLALLALLVAACGSDTGEPGAPGAGADAGSDGGVMLPAPERGFQIVTPDIVIPHGTEITYCYYFKMPNTETLPIKSWQSHMSPGSHHMILYTTPTEEQPEGTVDDKECGGAGIGSNAAVWTYSSQTVDEVFTLPDSDGTGLPVAQNVPPRQPAFIQMHYLNSTDHEITVHVELNANAYDKGVEVRGAAPYVTYHTNINLPAAPGSMATVNGSCTVSPRFKFFELSTHSHKQGIHTYVKDGSAMVFEAEDWEHPGAKTWDADPFFSFTSGKLYYQCDYLNAAGSRAAIVDGPSAATNEMCMAIGYYFDPQAATVPSKFCLNSSAF